MQLNMSFPERKISEAFLEFAEPFLEFDDQAPTPADVEKCLQLASTVWNAVVFDTVRGNTKFVTQVRQLMAEHSPMTELVEMLLLRKQSKFGHDLRLVGDYKVIQHNGEWRLRVEARAPSAT